MTETEITSQQNTLEEVTDTDKLSLFSDMLRNDIMRYDRQLDISEELE